VIIYNYLWHKYKEHYTLIYMVWRVEKHEITLKLIINHWTNEIL